MYREQEWHNNVELSKVHPIKEWQAIPKHSTVTLPSRFKSQVLHVKDYVLVDIGGIDAIGGVAQIAMFPREQHTGQVFLKIY